MEDSGLPIFITIIVSAVILGVLILVDMIILGIFIMPAAV